MRERLHGLLLVALALGAGTKARADEISDCLARMHVTDLQAQCARDPSGVIGAVSCQSVQAMIESARVSCAQEAQARKEQAEQERKRQEQKEVDDRVEKLKEYGSPGAYEDLAEDELSTAPDRIEAMRNRLHDLRPDYAMDALPDSKAVTALVAAERKCRASRRCMTARAWRKAEDKFYAETLLPMCTYSRQIQLAREDAARMHRPVGIDAGKLHDDTRTVTESRDRIRDLMPAYVARRHHAFRGWQTEPRCIEAEKGGRLRLE